MRFHEGKMKHLTRLFVLLLGIMIALTFVPMDTHAANNKRKVKPYKMTIDVGKKAKKKITYVNPVTKKKTKTKAWKKITLKKRYKIQLTATNGNKKLKNGTQVKYSSDNKSVATVNKNGLVETKNAGTANIIVNYTTDSIFNTTVDWEKMTFVAQLNVTNKDVPVSSVNLNKKKLSLEAGKTSTLSLTVNPVTATDQTATWTSSNPKVAKVSSKGKITAVAAGKATIKAKVGKKTASCAITVTKKKTDKTGDDTGKTGDDSGKTGDDSGKTGDDSGKTGENTSDSDSEFAGHYGDLTWKLTQLSAAPTYCLEITGNGALPDRMTGVEGYESPGWDDHKSEIVKIVIGSGVTKIGKQLFWGYDNVKTLELNEGLQVIDEEAFWGALGLEGELVIPASVISIEKRAFASCNDNGNVRDTTKYKMTSIVFKSDSKLRKIGQEAFYDIRSLSGSEISFPDSLDEIDGSAFVMYGDNDGFTKIHFGPNSRLTFIGSNAFYGHELLTSISTLPGTLEYLGSGWRESRNLNYIAYNGSKVMWTNLLTASGCGTSAYTFYWGHLYYDEDEGNTFVSFLK